jgi:hypothetical protein
LNDATQQPDPVSAAENLTESFRAMTAQMSRLTRSGRRLRRITIGLIVSLCLDLAITAGLGWNTVRQDDIQDSSHADQVSACRLANVSRGQDAAIWGTFLNDTAPAAARTPHVKALLAALGARIEAKDALRDCEALYKTR